MWDAFRRWGYLQADIDPLGRLKPMPHPELDVEGAEEPREVYCGSIGVEFMQLPHPQPIEWIKQRMEGEAVEVNRRQILERLASAEIFERVLQTRYVGTRRYSLEGSTALIPLLDEVIRAASKQGAEQAVLAMSHRGRLNVMVHTVGRRPVELFTAFEDVDPRSVLGSGDVKYHIGAVGMHGKVRVHLVSNPSHLEAVNPVAMGRARAKQTRLGQRGRVKVLPITLHGDAAFAGQGIAAETLNLADLRGYSVGGTIHIIVNNLIGFTTNPSDLHSTRFASDIAKRLEIPIFHVNGEDPDAVVRVGKMAVDYRYTFMSDVVIDLIGYRRHGHSEVEDTSITQPVLYKKIESMPPLWQSYAKQIGEEFDVSLLQSRFEREQEEARKATVKPVLRELPAYWTPYKGGPYDPAYEVDTGVRAEHLAKIGERATSTPEGFAAHPKVLRGLEQRREMTQGKRLVDWGTAEMLAMGSLVWEGGRVRLSGEDSRRGTFNQRHAVLLDVNTDQEHVPLEHLHEQQGPFECHDSPLSEASVLGFEYGFSRDYPEALVMWEAQFGDFVNGAQVIIDQFLAAGEDKWGLLSGLVLLLPHGSEGQGPEHSNARLDRFLQLFAEDNLQVAQPTTAAQYFHLLRRQVLRRWRKPLVVMTPKSLLRNPAAASPIESFTKGRFIPVLGDSEDAGRLLLCTGKIAHELRAERARRQEASAAIVTLEQLAPFPEKELAEEFLRHPAAKEIVWVQEEPANMGALAFVTPRLQRLAGGRFLRSIKRAASGSPATGSMKAHEIEQATLISMAFAKSDRTVR
jgi:2-oxoglutarate dehydrogenase E1 component